MNPTHRSGPSRRTLVWALLLVVGINLLLYAGTLGFDFLKDDHVLVVNNPRVKNLDVFTQTLGQRFFAFPDFSFLYYWRPLTLLSYLTDYALWGLNPLGFHLTNLILNAVAAGLVFLFFLAWGGRIRPALLIALWFSFFPLHAENVAWISGRPDLLAAVCILGAALAFLRFLDTRSNLCLAVAAACFLAGLPAKENVIVFPLIALGLILMRRQWRRGRIPLLGFFAAAGGYAVVHAHVTGAAGSLGRLALSQWSQVAATLGAYTRMILVPLFPDPYFSMDLLDTALLKWFAWAALAILLGVILSRARERAAYSRGAAVFLVLLLPVLNPSLVPSYPPVAMRFVYLPALAGGAVLTDVLLRLRRRLSRGVLVVFLAAGACALGAVNLVYQGYFQNDEVFYSRLVPHHSRDSYLLLPLALMRAHEGRYAEALQLVRRGNDLGKRDRWVDTREMSLLLESNLLLVAGDPAEGARLARRVAAETREPGMEFKAYMILAKYHQRRGDLSASLAELDRALKLGKTAELFLQRCLVLARMNRWVEARAAMDRARRMNPDLTDFARLERLLLQRGQAQIGISGPQPAPVTRGQ